VKKKNNGKKFNRTELCIYTVSDVKLRVHKTYKGFGIAWK